MTDDGTTDRERFGKQVQRRREQLGLSQRRAARDSGLSESGWRNVERGREMRAGVYQLAPNPPLRSTVRKIAQTLGWSENWALRAAGHSAPEPGTTDDAHTRDELDRVWGELSPAQQQALLHLAATIADPDLPAAEWDALTGPPVGDSARPEQQPEPEHEPERGPGTNGA